MYTVVIERKIGATQFVSFTGRGAAERMLDRANNCTNVVRAYIKG